MEDQIENIRLSFNCEADWNTMEQINGGRRCSSCNKTVYDFTDSRPYEFLQIMAENGNRVCGKFRPEQMAPIYIPLWKKWISAALILIGINVFNGKVQAQHAPGKATKADTLAATANDAMFGVIMAPNAEFPGGQEALLKFISKNLTYPKGAVDGKVFLTFVIKKDGSLSRIKVIRGLNHINDTEAKRVLKLSPKWKPSIENGKAVDSQYALPISFSKA